MISYFEFRYNLLNPECWDKLLMRTQSSSPVKPWQMVYFGSYHSTRTKVNGEKLHFANVNGNTLLVPINEKSQWIKIT